MNTVSNTFENGNLPPGVTDADTARENRALDRILDDIANLLPHKPVAPAWHHRCTPDEIKAVEMLDGCPGAELTRESSENVVTGKQVDSYMAYFSSDELKEAFWDVGQTAVQAAERMLVKVDAAVAKRKAARLIAEQSKMEDPEPFDEFTGEAGRFVMDQQAMAKIL